MDIKAEVVHTAFEKQAAFFNKGEIPFKAEIRNGIINQQQAEPGYRNPEKHLEKNPGGSLQGGDSAIVHTVGCVQGGCPGQEQSINQRCYKFVKGMLPG
jgi:hypothetical protein